MSICQIHLNVVAKVLINAVKSLSLHDVLRIIRIYPFFFIISRRASNKFGSTSTKYMLIACKGADFIGHLQRFTSISLSVLPLYYLYITSTLPLHKLCRMSTNSSIVVFDTALKTIKLIRPPLLSCSDGTFRSFQRHLRVVPMAL